MMIEKIVSSFRRLVGSDKIRNKLNTLATKEEVLELRQANLFHDTIVDSEWFRYKTISLGEWAIDYGTAYIVY